MRPVFSTGYFKLKVALSVIIPRYTTIGARKQTCFWVIID